MGGFKLTKREKSWILYDVGNSAFTMLVSTLIPIYFNALAESAGISSINYLAYWGYAGSIATLLVAIIGPVFGTLADRKNFKKPIFIVALALGAVACAFMGFAWSWLAFLVIYVLSKVCYSSSLVFYDAMLPETTTEERMDIVSSQATPLDTSAPAFPLSPAWSSSCLRTSWGLPREKPCALPLSSPPSGGCSCPSRF